MKRSHYCYLLTRALPEGGCRYYVGIRTCPVGKTPEEDTSYMGSGRWIKHAVKAHPGEFSKTIVEVFETRAEAKAMERALVGLPTANSPWSFNLVTGGEDGGLKSEATKAKHRDTLANLSPEELATNTASRARGLRRAWAGCAPEQRRARTVAATAPEIVARRTATRKAMAACLTPEERRAMTSAAAKASRSPRARANLRAAVRERFADPSERARTSASCRRAWANATPEQRAARIAASVKGKRRAKAERSRVQREVQMMLAALIVNKYGGAEAA